MALDVLAKAEEERALERAEFAIEALDTVLEATMDDRDTLRRLAKSWRRACHDAIARPMGVVPDSATEAERLESGLFDLEEDNA